MMYAFIQSRNDNIKNKQQIRRAKKIAKAGYQPALAYTLAFSGYNYIKSINQYLANYTYTNAVQPVMFPEK